MNTRKNVMLVKLEAVPNPDFSVHDHAGRVRVPVHHHQVHNFVTASRICMKYIKMHDLGHGNWAGGQIYENGVAVAHVSYNGRIWWGKEDAPTVGPEVHFYKAYPTIPIPLCLDNKDWTDDSWNNDVTARSQMVLTDEHTLEVFVHPFMLEDRETPDYIHRYVVGIYGEDGNLVIPEINCKNETEIVAAIATLKKWEASPL